MKLQKSADLQYIDLPTDGYEQTIVLLHGYGADANDLAPLSREIKTKKKTRWIFVNAPQPVIIDAFTTGRAWFEIDIMQLSLLMQKGHFDAFIQRVPQGLEFAREQLLNFLFELEIDISKTILGGFSQGAMVAADLAFHLDQNPKGLILFSASLVNKDEWQKIAPRRKGLQFYQSHGKNDPLLRVELAQQLELLLKTSGLRGSLNIFNGAHEIPTQIIDGATRFVNGL